MPDTAALQGLLQDICTDPRDDALRRIYADALEDAGDLPRATLIRLMLHRPGTLSRPVRALLRDHGEAWAAPLPALQASQRVGDFRIRWRWHRGFVSAVVLPLTVWMRYGPQLVRRHPLDSVRTDRRSLGAVVVRSLSSERPTVCFSWYPEPEFSDRAPAYSLPRVLWKHLRGYRPVPPEYAGTGWREYSTEKEAEEALAAALLQWAWQAEPAQEGETR